MRTLTAIMCAALAGCAARQEDTMETGLKTKGSCCDSACCGGEAAQAPERAPDARQVTVDFLYLDLDVCERCVGTGERLQEAVSSIDAVLKAAGVDVTIRKVHVISEEQAKALAFVSSPTVRVQGRDVQLGGKESTCGECGELADCGVECRVWTWRGADYTVPPKEMLVDAVLRSVYQDARAESVQPAPLKELPENLQRFFRGRK